MAVSLRVLHWNARGLKSKVAPLRLLLKDQKIDVALISETHLGPADKIRFPGYYLYRKDEKSAVGYPYRGLAVLVRRRVVHQPLPSTSPSTLYALGIQVHVAGEDLNIFAAYIPPAAKYDLAELRAILQQSPGPSLLAGDLNCKHPAWNSHAANPGGNRLFADAQAHGYYVTGPETPTHYPDARAYVPDVLDVIVHKGLNCQITQQVLDDEMLSDHQPVLAVLAGMPIRLSPPAPRRQTDWTTFQEVMETTTPTWPVVSSADVDRLAEDVTVCIQRAYEEATTIIPRPQGIAFRPLPKQLRDLVRETRRLRKRWQQTKCPAQKAQLNRHAERVRAKLQAFNTESWEDHIASTEGDWPAIHKLCRQLTKTPAPVRPLLHSDGAPRYSAPDRAEIFAECLERQFQPNPTVDHDHVAAVERHLRDYFATPIAPDEDPIFFSPNAVGRAILGAKPRKAPGADGITNTALRHLPYRSVAALARLFTAVLRTGVFPACWKEGCVIMLPKANKNVLKPESYRPITLLPTMSKDRSFRVVVDGALSSARPVAAGVPQGSCVSPVCYSHYTDDIPTTPETTLALYADDAAYVGSSLNARHAAVKVQRVLDLLPEWLSKWRLSVNVGKTQALLVGSARHPPPLQLLGADIAWSPQVRYLGVTIDRRLSMRSHVRQVTAKSRVARALLRPVLSSRLPLRAKLGVYKTYIRPLITYAAPAWLALTSETSKTRLRAQQNLTLRTIVDAPSLVRNAVIERDLRMESLDKFCARLASNMFARADASAWPHVKQIAPWHARPPDAKRFPRDLLPDVANPPDLTPE
ncbi:hypothetical protein PYW07_008180 [Mythimna separata]|uniref:Reverse transcriptase domain-containing protein n=1 Tax=Mythimna separata TaxID=271217 RepID=A0AAD7YQI7_MYTSE|nr:hypothetical protein PYW07_008180 [Mythimna separata]